MISSEVQRTLVKSPPELWAEISNPDSLARHLGEFGEIRITRVEPEQRVDWEADDTSGSVVIKPSGWGTKVKLTVNRELAQLATDDTDDEASVEAASVEQAAEPLLAETQLAAPRHPESQPEQSEQAGSREEPELAQPQPEPDMPGIDSADAPTETQSESEPPTTAPEPRRGFFARLFGRRRVTPLVPTTDIEPEVEGSLEADAEADLPEDTPTPLAPPAGTSAAPAPPAPDRYNALAVWAAQIEPTPAGEETDADTREAEEVAVDEVTAVLTGVLDRLGSAHHRPFSRG